MSEPFLKFEERQRVLRVVKLGGQSGPCSMAGDAPTGIRLRYAGFAAKEWDQSTVQITGAQTPASITKQIVDHLTCFSVEGRRLQRPHLFPGDNRLTKNAIDWLCKGRAGLVGGDVQETDRTLREDLER